MARLFVGLLIASGLGCSASPDGDWAGGSGAAGDESSGGSQASGSGGGGAGGTGSAGDAGAAPTGGAGAGPSTCEDACAFSTGVTWQCHQRFMYGLNYAWLYFGADFGGIAAWSQPGVAANAAEHSQRLARMRASGISTVRWWVFPDFRGDGISFDGSDMAQGLQASTMADLDRALELAEQHDLYLMLTLFSFDAFRYSRTEGNVYIRGLSPIARDESRRSALLENVVRPVARRVEASARRHRMIAWDVINEPEWAIAGPNRHGGPDFTPDHDLDAISHEQMETFISSVITVLRTESRALVSVGAAATKWATAWSQLDTDFHQFHIYDWVHRDYPYDSPPAAYGLTDKPVVMGEFPLGGLGGSSYGEVVRYWYENGYAGALGWDYNGASAGELAGVKAFADAHPCETRY